MNKTLTTGIFLAGLFSTSLAGRTQVYIIATGTSSGNGTLTSASSKNGYKLSLNAAINQVTPPHDNVTQLQTWETTGNGMAIMVIWTPSTPGETPPKSATVKATFTKSAEAFASIAAQFGVRISIGGDVSENNATLATAEVNGRAGTQRSHYPKNASSKAVTKVITIPLTLQPEGTYMGMAAHHGKLSCMAGSSVDGGAATIKSSASFNYSIAASLRKLNF